LDAGGIGGSEVLFQTGGAQWTEAFAKSAPRPHGAVIAQDLFATGLLQSDTDYRIFRDYGQVVGIDLAFYKDGYVESLNFEFSTSLTVCWLCRYLYHTDRDVIDNLQAGSIQHEGDNALAYLQYVGTHPTLLNEAHRGQKNANSVFVDFIGRYMLVYPMKLQYVMSLVLVLVVLAYFFVAEGRRHRVREILQATAFVHLAFLAGLVVCLVVGLFIQFGLVRPLLSLVDFVQRLIYFCFPFRAAI